MLEDLLRPTHLIVVFAVIAILFPSKIAGLGAGLGKSIRDFKKAVGGENEPPPTASNSADPKSLP
jgi:sec-independent protein translocase protein TatA